MKRKSKPRKTMRIYYGTGKTPLYWQVRVSDAKKDVTINGTLMDALRATPGQTIGCHLSNCVTRNPGEFPHLVYLAAFTKSTCLVVDKISGGQPSHAIRYSHSYGSLVDLNDTDVKRLKVKENPQLVERTFTLRKPQKRNEYVSVEERRRRGWTLDKDGSKRQIVPRGALRRARKAGLVTADLANAIALEKA